MLKTLNLQNKVEDCVSSYESRIENIASVCENAHAVLYGFQKSFLDTNREREEIAAKLQNTLAQNEHLRKKDFELIMRRAGVSVQEGREKEVKDLLDIYFNEQKEMAKKLRENLDGFKVSLAKGEARRIREFQTLLKDIFVRQNERKEEVTAKLKEFKEERNETALKLKALLTKGRELRIKDLKLMLGEFKRKRSGSPNISAEKGDKNEVKIIGIKG